MARIGNCSDNANGTGFDSDQIPAVDIRFTELTAKLTVKRISGNFRRLTPTDRCKLLRCADCQPLSVNDCPTATGGQEVPGSNPGSPTQKVQVKPDGVFSRSRSANTDGHRVVTSRIWRAAEVTFYRTVDPLR